MRVGILGTLTVEADGRVVEVGGARLRTLLARLAAEPGRLVPVDQLAGALWPLPGAAPADPANAIQSLVSRLRKALGGDPALVSGVGGYRLDVPPDAVDAYRFERLAADGRAALRAGDRRTAAAVLREGLDLWRGPALLDIGALPFAEPLAARWEELRLGAIEDHIEAHGLNDFKQQIARLQELTAAHPLRERLAALLVRALHAAGRRAEALAAYEEIRARLADELGVDPSPELREAHLAALREEPAAWEPVGNLRTPLTSFVGRAGDVERLATQVLDNRLVTLVGPGGAGKTRLATTVARAAAADFPDGVWLVELAPVAESAEVPSAVLRTLHAGGLAFQEALHRPRRLDVVGQLAEALAGSAVLLVLDNCEHVVDAAANLSEELLGRCPKLRILATSREPLGILGETLFPVGPLPLPAGTTGTTGTTGTAGTAGTEDGAQAPAVQLLRDRAAAVRPGFAVTEDNVAAVVEICRRLDGLPLAIELAAARLRSFSVEQVAARLDDRFRLLTGGSRTALPRHRTLHAVVAWSWDLLGPQERSFGAALAVFPGSFDAAAAAAVTGVPEPQPLLDMLVDRSLLQVVDGAVTQNQVRYRMLETIREFALEELVRAGQVGAARTAHAAYFLALMERAEPHLRTSAQVTWLARLRPERDNFHAAVAHVCDAGDALSAFRLGAAAGWFWTFEEDHAEAAAWLGRILSVPDEVPGKVPADLRTVVTAVYVVNSGFAGDFQLEPSLLDEVVALARSVPPGTGHPFVTLVEPVVLLFRDDSERGAELIEQRLAGPIDTWSRAMLLSILGHLRENDGDVTGMLRALELSAAAMREVGERWGLSMTLASLADAYARRGDFAAAVAQFEESIQLYRELGTTANEAYQRVRLAAIRAHTAGPAAAREELLLLVSDPSVVPRDVSHAMLELGQLARRAGDLDEAERCYARAWQLLGESALVAPQYRALLLTARAQLDIRRGALDAAREKLADAMALALPVRDMPVVAQVGIGAAALAEAEGRTEVAAEILGAAHQLGGGVDLSNVDLTAQSARLRAELGGAGFDSAVARGAALDRTAALDLLAP